MRIGPKGLSPKQFERLKRAYDNGAELDKRGRHG